MRGDFHNSEARAARLQDGNISLECAINRKITLRKSDFMQKYVVSICTYVRALRIVSVYI